MGCALALLHQFRFGSVSDAGADSVVQQYSFGCGTEFLWGHKPQFASRGGNTVFHHISVGLQTQFTVVMQVCIFDPDRRIRMISVW